MSWHLFQGGQLVRVDAPEWAKEPGDFDKTLNRNGWLEVQTFGDEDTITRLEVYRRGTNDDAEEPDRRWLFIFSDVFNYYCVEAVGFPAYLGLLNLAAPMIAANAACEAVHVNVQVRDRIGNGSGRRAS